MPAPVRRPTSPNRIPPAGGARPAVPAGKPGAAAGSGRLNTKPVTQANGAPPSAGRPIAGGNGGSGGGGVLTALMVLMVGLFGFFYFLAYQGDGVDAEQPASGSTVPNMKSLLAVGLSSGKNLTITEEQINGYLAATSTLRQGGPMAQKAPIERVAVRLKDGEFHVVIARRLFGRPHTVAVHFTPTQSGAGENAQWSVQPTGGKVGKLPVAGGLLQMVLPPVIRLAGIYSDELKILRYASSVRVEDGRLLLGPVVVRQ